MSARDRKLLMMLAPVATFALYWMLLMNPALSRRESLRAVPWWRALAARLSLASLQRRR